MIKQYRSYSDHEIANYVLGVKLADSTMAGIQHNLYSDNASAARALKWEAYFLALADGLTPETPDDAILNKIQHTLNIRLATDEDLKVVGDNKRSAAVTDYLDGKAKDKAKWKNKLGLKLNKVKVTVIILIVALIALFTWASLDKPKEKTMVKETLNLIK